MTDAPTQSVPFRSAATPVEPTTQAPAKPDGPSYRAGSPGDDTTPYVHQELTKKPYAVKYLDIGIYFDDPDFEDVRAQARALDQYVIRQAKANGLKDSHESYKEVVEAIYKQIGKSPNEDPVKALKRLSTAVGALERLNKAKLQPVLNAKTLEPDEFEDVQP